jgi:hypothetical protein
LPISKLNVDKRKATEVCGGRGEEEDIYIYLPVPLCLLYKIHNTDMEKIKLELQLS